MAPASDHQTGPAAPPSSLPVLTVDASSSQILDKLDEAARRGRLAGFERGKGDDFFTTSAFGSPFEGSLVAHADSAAGATRLRFTTRLRPRLLWVFVIVLLVSIWPGAPITKSLLATWVPSWRWLWETTYWWYLPLAVIGAPWSIWSTVRRSRKEIAVSAAEMVGKVQKELGAWVRPG